MAAEQLKLAKKGEYCEPVAIDRGRIYHVLAISSGLEVDRLSFNEEDFERAVDSFILQLRKQVQADIELRVHILQTGKVVSDTQLAKKLKDSDDIEFDSEIGNKAIIKLMNWDKSEDEMDHPSRHSFIDGHVDVVAVWRSSYEPEATNG